MHVLARPEFQRALLVAIVVIAAMVAATAFFGWDAPGTYQIVPDPAGAMPF